MTSQQLTFLVLFYAIAIAMGLHMVWGIWLLARAETRLRAGLAYDDVDTYSHEPIDDAYLAESGRVDRRRGWRLLKRGLLIGALLVPVYITALLLHIGIPT